MPTFKAYVPPPPKVKQPKATSAASVKKPPSQRRRPLEDTAKVYADALFESALLPIKITYVTFYDLLTNNVRISKCRKFAIEYNPNHHQETTVIPADEKEDTEEITHTTEIPVYSLFFFAQPSSPLMAYNCDIDKEFTIPKEKATESFLELTELSPICVKIIELEKADQIAKLKAEMEANDENATGTTNSSEPSTDIVSEDEGTKTESNNEEEIRTEASEKREEQTISEDQKTEGN